MPLPIDEKLLHKRHQKMLAYQETIKPFTPTVRELKRVWKVSSLHTAGRTLARLVEMGLVLRRKKYNGYYAVQEAAEQCVEPTEGTLPVKSSDSVGGSH